MNSPGTRNMRILATASRRVINVLASKETVDVAQVPSAAARAVLNVAALEAQARARTRIRAGLFALGLLIITIIPYALVWAFVTTPANLWTGAIVALGFYAAMLLARGADLHSLAVALGGRDAE